MSKEYASITQNTELRYTVAEGKEYNDGAHAQFILAKIVEKFFTYNGIEYSIIQEDEDLYIITRYTSCKCYIFQRPFWYSANGGFRSFKGT